MMEQRPNPDDLLARARAAEAQHERGRLKIFFGAAAGVGKTYAMLEAARERLAEGVDVVAGYVETHGRVETAALLRDLEVLERRTIAYRGTVLEEFGLDAALARNPQLILVDELAHTNAPGSRHPKRYQDVDELLAAGIDVYTTVNVQHIESLNDVVAQITGVIVRETVPDRILDQADEVELIDLTPDDLLQRLKEGKVYMPQQAAHAIHNFFRKGNLIALRELALRRTTDHINAEMQGYRREHAIVQTWPTDERILVAIGPGPHALRLVRAGCRMAARLRAAWIVVYIETPAHQRLTDVEREQVIQTLHRAEQLGAEVVTLTAQKVSAEILAYAHHRNVGRIVVGKPIRSRWQEFLFGSVVDDLVRESGAIDLYIISGDGERVEARGAPAPPVARANYGWALLVVVLCTLLAWLMFPFFDLSNLIMVYLVGVVVVAARFARGPAIVASLLSVAAFDIFFVPPYYTFAVSDAQYLVTFAVMLAVAIVISTLTVRLRQQAEAARERERRTAALYALSRAFASVREVEALLRIAVRHLSDIFGSQIVVLLPNAGGRLQAWGRYAGWWGREVEGPMVFAPSAADQGVAQWVYEHHQPAGWATQTLPGAEALYLPLVATRGTIGVLGVRPAPPRHPLAPDKLHLLETFVNQTALALERADLADEAAQAHVQVETERLRSSLLSSVSHDLRTPLAAITGAASTLLDSDTALGLTTRNELVQGIYDEADRLNRLVANLLDMTRLESGAVHVHKEWQPLEEVIGAARNRLDVQLHGHPMAVQLPPDLPLVPLDGVLIEQVLVNLLDNAIKYTPPGSPITLSAEGSASEVTVIIADRGPGILSGDEQRIFEKFYRAMPSTAQGAGLGLAICRGIILAHGGRIWAENRPAGGTAFAFTLPLEGTPPTINMVAEEVSNVGRAR
jgi:two-component system sensor histidine kinase KdpD